MHSLSLLHVTYLLSNVRYIHLEMMGSDKILSTIRTYILVMSSLVLYRLPVYFEAHGSFRERVSFVSLVLTL
jgi:hypothetical protein